MAPLSAAQLLELSETNVSHRLTPEEFLPALTQAPFINVEGTFNVRDLGKIPSVDANGGGGGVRPGFAFRSGMLVSLTPNGKATLAKDLGVRRVFDLRSKSEHATLPDPAVSEDVTIVWQEAAEETPHVSLEPFIEGVGEAGFADMYLDVLRAYRPTIKLVLEHVRDRPQEPFLFHCTGTHPHPFLIIVSTTHSPFVARLSANTTRDMQPAVIVLAFLLACLRRSPAPRLTSWN